MNDFIDFDAFGRLERAITVFMVDVKDSFRYRIETNLPHFFCLPGIVEISKISRLSIYS